MRASQFLQTLLVKLSAFPKCIHLFVNLLGIERSQLLAQLFQSYSSLDVGHKIEYLHLCWGEGNCFHNTMCFKFSQPIGCKDSVFF